MTVRSSLPTARFARPFAGRQPGRRVDEIDRRALAHALGEIERVPVRQPDATVRVGLADPFRVRRAVNAVALLGEIDPHRADRIVRTWRDRELAVGVDTLELEFRIVMVGRIMRDPTDPELSARRWLLLAPDRSRIERDRLALVPERADRPRRLVDFDPGHASGNVAFADVGHQDRGSGLLETLARIEQREQLRVDVEFLAQQLERARVGEMIETSHLFQAVGDRLCERSFDVLLADCILDDGRLAEALRELLPGLLVELPGRVEPMRLLESGDRLTGVLAVLAADLPGRNSGSIQQYLRFEHERMHPVELERGRDRKSTRLNSSHVEISYAVFCLK